MREGSFFGYNTKSVQGAINLYFAAVLNKVDNNSHENVSVLLDVKKEGTTIFHKKVLLKPGFSSTERYLNIPVSVDGTYKISFTINGTKNSKTNVVFLKVGIFND